MSEFLSRAGLGGFPAQEIVEAVEVVEQADCGRNLYNFALGVEGAQAREVFFGVAV